MTRFLEKLHKLFLPLSALERYLLGLWLVIIAFIPFHALISTWGGSATGSLLLWKSWKEIGLCIAVPLAIYVLHKRHKLRSFADDKLVVLVLGYVALHLLLWVIARPDAQAAIAGLLMNLRFLAMILLAMVLVEFIDRNELLKITLPVLLGTAGVVVLVALLQIFILPNDFLKHFGYGPATISPYTTLDNNESVIRVMSTLRGPNPFGEYLMLVLLLWLSIYKKHRRWLVVIGAALLFWLEYKTYSRSAWIGLAVALLVFGWLSIKNHAIRKKVFLSTAAVMVMLAVGVAFALPRSPQLQSVILHNQHSDTDEGSTVAHAQAGVASLNRIAEQPLGHGPGAAGPASFYGPEPRVPENYYLQIAEEVGLIGLAVFAAVNLLALSRIWHARYEWWPRVLIASLAGISIINLFLHGWADDTSALLWWGIAGLFTLKNSVE